MTRPVSTPSAPPQSPRSLKNRAQRERILDAARSLFASRGFDAVTMGDVAEQAGVVRATVFNQFGSKGALVEAITEGVLDDWAGMLENALADEATSDARRWCAPCSITWVSASSSSTPSTAACSARS